MQHLIRQLRVARVAVVASAGNHFFEFNGEQGMGFPAICRQTISVGAIYDDRKQESQGLEYPTGAVSAEIVPDKLTPFSQRLHPTVPWSLACRTDIFAPGSPIEATGIGGPRATSRQRGTSQAGPLVAGVALLMQELYLKEMKEIEPNPKRPQVEDLERWLRGGGVRITDSALHNNRPYDNVPHTGLPFIRVDALGALDLVKAETDLAKALRKKP
jgi:Subtilase family